MSFEPLEPLIASLATHRQGSSAHDSILARIANAVGSPLAGRFFRPDVASRLAAMDSNLLLEPAGERGEPGSADLLFALQQPFDGSFASAFALPVRWVKGRHHDSRLPDGLKEVADLVRSEMKVSAEWGLQAAWSGTASLSTFRWETGSAFASLAVALYTAKNQIRPSGSVMVSAAWDKDAGVPVDVKWVSEKANAARRAGADTLFVSGTHTEWCVDGLHLRRLPLEPKKFSEFIAAMLEAIDAEPSPEASFDERCRYHNRLVERDNRTKADDYYAHRIAADAAIRARSNRSQQGLDLPSGDAAIVATGRYGLSVFEDVASDAADLLVLHLDDPKSVALFAKAIPILDELRGARDKPPCHTLVLADSNSSQIAAWVDALHAQGVTQVWLTGGPRRLMLPLALALAAEEIQIWVVASESASETPEAGQESIRRVHPVEI